MGFITKAADFCESYFNGFKDISNCEKNDAKANVLAVVKILSYFTVVIPLGFAAVYGAASLYGRVSKKESLSPQDKNVHDQAMKQLNSNKVCTNDLKKQDFDKEGPHQITQTLDSKKVHSYTGDLTSSQKLNIKTKFINDNILQIDFPEVPDLNVTIRPQDIFDSHAQVIINAANTHLGGGGGIDGAIHARGGSKYQAAHRELQMLYKSKYISGHAALIESGLLKENCNIHNVIVVAGPQGETNPEKESELYSCYYNSLTLAENQNKTSIAFPSISTGIFGFPKDRAACISLKAIYDFIERHPDTKLKNISIHFLGSRSKTDLEMYKNSCN